METKFTLNEFTEQDQMSKHESKDLEHVIDMIMVECRDYNPILMFLMGLNYHAFLEESSPEALLEVTSRIQSKIELLGPNSPEAGDIFRFLLAPECLNNVFKLPYFQPSPDEFLRENIKKEEVLKIDEEQLEKIDSLRSTPSDNLETPECQKRRNKSSSIVFPEMTFLKSFKRSCSSMRNFMGRTWSRLRGNTPHQNYSECPICLSQIKTEDLCSVECGHIFHTECMETYIRLLIGSKSLPIKCPLQDCRKLIPDSDLRSIIEPELFERMQRFQLELFVEQNSVFYHFCPTPDCTNVFEWDFTKGQSPHQHCPVCSLVICLKCKTPWHQGYTCEEISKMQETSPEDVNFYILTKQAMFQQCPECKFWVQRKDGCNQIICRCQCKFCYECGSKYGSSGCYGYCE
ncbi:unnamed protein product [Moneuplotes crassus]|uniref:RBR-type E3 ubiquitin transferase n=1 Tax=Euplotes crassus TaxID=5936 RepID=A0AAD1UHL4_EUPCR|nr:unnamed protein product [Moneuplotes crassus]